MSDYMTLDEIKQLIEFIKSHELSEFELEHDGVKIRIKSGCGHHVMPLPQMVAAPPVMAPVAAPTSSPASPANATKGKVVRVKSGMDSKSEINFFSCRVIFIIMRLVLPLTFGEAV